jgi:hypothetical protein
MSWFVDNANALYLLLGLTAASLVVAWRFDQRVKFLGYAAGVVALMAVLWLLTQVVPSDRNQLEQTILAMSRAVVAGKQDELFRHISKDFRYQHLNRDEMYKKTQLAIQTHQVRDIRITSFRVEEVSREKKSARTSFRVSTWLTGHEGPQMFGTQADFVLEGDEWKLKTLRFYNPIANQDTEISLPLP